MPQPGATTSWCRRCCWPLRGLLSLRSSRSRPGNERFSGRVVLRLVVVLSGTTAFGFIHGAADIFTMIIFRDANGDTPPGTGYLTVATISAVLTAIMTLRRQRAVQRKAASGPPFRVAHPCLSCRNIRSRAGWTQKFPDYFLSVSDRNNSNSFKRKTHAQKTLAKARSNSGFTDTTPVYKQPVGAACPIHPRRDGNHLDAL
jgi:hypothetical protein